METPEERQRRELFVDGPWTDSHTASIIDGPVDRVLLNYASGFNEPTLDFLVGLPIRELFLLDYRIVDLDPIYTLADTLEILTLTASAESRLDVARLPGLRGLSSEWFHVSTSIHAATKVEDLFVGSFDGTDLRPLRGLNRLVNLRMKDRVQPTSLDGLNEFPRLTNLQVASASRLADLSALRFATTLESLEITGARKIERLDDLAGLNLRFLRIGDLGKLESFRPLSGLSNLEELWVWGDTRIGDNDLSPIAELTNLQLLRMANRRSYTPRVADIQDAIAARAGDPPH